MIRIEWVDRIERTELHRKLNRKRYTSWHCFHRCYRQHNVSFECQRHRQIQFPFQLARTAIREDE